MGACVSQEIDPCDFTQDIVDVQKVIAEAVWRDHRKLNMSCWDKLTKKRKDFIVDIPKQYFLFEKTRQEIRFLSSDTADSTPEQTYNSLLSSSKLPRSNKASPQYTTLQTIFRNDTGETQTYNFSFEKTRVSSATVSCEKGFTFGGSTDFSIGLPSFLPGGKMTSGISMELQVTKTDEQTFKQSSTTSVTSEIIVSQYSQCMASVVLEDNHFRANFKVYVTMTMASGGVPVHVRTKRGKILYKNILDNLPKIFHDQPNKGRNDVEFIVKGVINATQTSQQRIDLDCQLLR